MVNSFREIFSACAINDRETQKEKLIIYSLGDKKPVQWAKTRENMIILWRFEDHTGSNILFLFFFFFFLVYPTDTYGFQQEESYSHLFFRRQKHRSVFWLRQQKACEEWCWVCRVLGVCHSAKAQDKLLERQSLVENDTEAAKESM